MNEFRRWEEQFSSWADADFPEGEFMATLSGGKEETVSSDAILTWPHISRYGLNTAPPKIAEKVVGYLRDQGIDVDTTSADFNTIPWAALTSMLLPLFAVQRAGIT